MKPKALTKLFNKFAGREVPMVETKMSHNIGGKKIEYTRVELANPQDPTLEEMKKVAADNGLKLRMWYPGSAGTCDFRTDRVNARIEKEADGKYRVAKKFNIG